jgi:hypothetical protein
LSLDLILIGALVYLSNAVLSILIALIIINKLYISKKFSKKNEFHFYNDLFSWEIFFFFIAADNLLKILSVFLHVDDLTSDILLKIRILIVFIPFWSKIIHLEKVMDKITYERHYIGGLIPIIMIFLLVITGLPNEILAWSFFITTFIPYILFAIFLQNTGTSTKKSLKVISGLILVGLACILRPEILDLYIVVSIATPLALIIGTLLLFASFQKELFA